MKITAKIILTWSKITAWLILLLAFVLDLLNDKGGTVFMFTVPFAVALITGKQFFDREKPDPEKNNQT